MEISQEATVAVLVLVVAAEVTVVIEDTIRVTKVVVAAVVVAAEVAAVVVVVITRVTKVAAAVTTDLVVAIIKPEVVVPTPVCRVTTHKVVLDIIRAGVIRPKVSSKVNNKPGVNKAGEIRDNKAGEHKAMDSGAMANNNREPIQTRQHKLIMLQHGEPIILVPGPTGGLNNIISNINNGTVSKPQDNMHRLVPLQVQLPRRQLQAVPLPAEHLKLLNILLL